MLVLQVIAFFYILIFAKESEASTTDVEDCSNGSLKIYFVLVDGESKTSFEGFVSRILWGSLRALSDYRQLLVAKRRHRLILGMNLVAFGIELFIFAGERQQCY